MTLGASQREAFRIIGRSQKSDHRRALRFSGGVAFQSVAGGDDGDVLQDGGGLTLGATVGSASKEYIDASAGADEASDGDDLIDADGDGTHAGWNQ